MAFQIPGSLLQGIINPKVADPVGANIAANAMRTDTDARKATGEAAIAKTAQLNRQARPEKITNYFMDIATAAALDPESRKKFLGGAMKERYADVPGLNDFIGKVNEMPEKETLTALFRMIEKGKEMGQYKGGRDQDAESKDNKRKVYRKMPGGGVETRDNLTKEQQDALLNNQGAKPRWQAGSFEKDPTKDKDQQDKATNFLLPNKDVVISYDQKTYEDSEGKSKKLPFGATKINTTANASTLSLFAAQKQAQDELEKMGDTASAGDVAKKALTGTGPWSNLRAATDAVIGGVGIDKIWTEGGLFPETQNNRQALRLIKQIGKAAIMNSSRGPIWEQEKIEKEWFVQQVQAPKEGLAL